MNENSIDDTEINFFEIFLFLFSNLKILFFGSTFGALIALIFALYFPPKYESLAVQSGGSQLVAIYNSYQVLDVVIQKTEYAENGEDLDSSRLRLLKDISVSFNAKEKTVKLAVRGKNPKKVKQILDVWVEQAAVLNQVRLDDLRRMKDQFDLAVAREKEYDAAAKKIAVLIESASRLDQSLLVQSQLQLLDSARSAQATSASLAAAIQQAEQYELLQKPNLATHGVPRHVALIVIVAFFGTGFLLLLVLQVKMAWVRFVQNPESAEKLNKIKMALR